MPDFCVLHVCMGNICRSPMAERLFVLAARERVGDKADELVRSASAGTGGWHAGEEMSPPAAREVRRRGGDTRGFAASKLRGDLLDSADLVLTATAEQQYYVLGLRAQIAPRTFVLGEFGRLLGNVDPSALPPYEPTADAVFARGTALVEAAAALRAGAPAEPEDDLDDPWGRGDAYFRRVADEIDQALRPFVSLLFPA